MKKSIKAKPCGSKIFPFLLILFLFPAEWYSGNPGGGVTALAGEPDSSAQEDQTVFVARVRSLDAFFDALAVTIKTDHKATTSFAYNRDYFNEALTADGPDFSRPFGLVIRKGPQGLFPIYFVPVTDKVHKLSNIILLPQIYLPVRDEYGPTNRYKVRQDIPVLGGLHFFYWSGGELFAEERNGWIIVTTEAGFGHLTENPLDMIANRKYRTGELFWTWLDKTALTEDDSRTILDSFRVMGKQWMTPSSWEIPTLVGKKIQQLVDNQSRFVRESDLAEIWLCQEPDIRIATDVGRTSSGKPSTGDFIFTRRSYQKKPDGSTRQSDRKYRLAGSLVSWAVSAGLEYDTAAEEQRMGPILEIPQEIFDIEL